MQGNEDLGAFEDFLRQFLDVATSSLGDDDPVVVLVVGVPLEDDLPGSLADVEELDERRNDLCSELLVLQKEIRRRVSIDGEVLQIKRGLTMRTQGPAMTFSTTVRKASILMSSTGSRPPRLMILLQESSAFLWACQDSRALGPVLATDLPSLFAVVSAVMSRETRAA